MSQTRSVTQHGQVGYSACYSMLQLSAKSSTHVFGSFSPSRVSRRRQNLRDIPRSTGDLLGSHREWPRCERCERFKLRLWRWSCIRKVTWVPEIENRTQKYPVPLKIDTHDRGTALVSFSWFTRCQSLGLENYESELTSELSLTRHV